MKATFLSLTLSAGVVAAADWPQWRGPARDGHAPSAPRAAWPAALARAWTAPVGIGHSSPVVGGGRVFVHAREGEEEVVTAHDLETGKTVWRQAYPAPYTMNPAAAGHGKGPKSTPVLAGNRICTLGISGILHCLDAATGRILWRKDFAGQFKDTAPLYGTGMSPVVDEGRLIAHVGGHGDGALTAFDLETGAVRWAWKGDGPGYASPVVATIGGTRQVITLSQEHVVGVDAGTGALLWKAPFSTEYSQSIPTPVIDGDVVIYSGIGQPLRAARIARAAGWKAEPLWENPEAPMYMSTPVLEGGVLYGMTHRRKGQFVAVDPRTGKTLWVAEGRAGDNASVVSAWGALLLLTTDGTLTVARPDPKVFAPVRTYTVAESAVWAHPAVAGDSLYIKDAQSLTRWRIP